MSCCGACGGQDLENEQSENKKIEQNANEAEQTTEQPQKSVETFDPRN